MNLSQLSKKEDTNLKFGFNAVIIGDDYDSVKHLEYKIAQLDVPERVSIVNDGFYRFNLYARSEDFKSIELLNGKSEAGNEEVSINSLSLCHGVVLPFKEGAYEIFGRPRTVLMNDGRIYIEEKMLQDEQYIEFLHKRMVPKAGDIFRDEDLRKLYSNLLEVKKERILDPFDFIKKRMKTFKKPESVRV